MITIALIIVAGIIFILSQIGIIKIPFIIFVVAAIIIGIFALVLKDRLNCPFAKKCPFTICPLNKAESK
ncbi:MAG: hypothetical protein KJ915_02510 [Candidatus Omnitrophica bacterium]|nr:hypothetical protein [Candidatus Omnitrophota bacterium]